MRLTRAGWFAALLATLCVALAWGASRATRPLYGPADTGQGEPGMAAIAPGISAEPEFAMPPAEVYAEITERPLFAPGRRPTPGGAPIAARPSSTPDAILRGIVAAGDQRTALFTPMGGGGVLRLREADELNGWRLVEIAPGHVVFRRGDAEVRLDLTYEQPPPLPVDERRRRSQRAIVEPAPPEPEAAEEAPDLPRN